MMGRAILVMLIAASGGCATASTGQVASDRSVIPAGHEVQQMRHNLEGTQTTTEWTRDRHVSYDEIPRTPSSIFAMLPEVYRSLGIQFEGLDATGKVMSSVLHRLRGKLGDKRLSSYIICGSTIAGSNADAYHVTLRVRTAALPAGEGYSQVSSWLLATASSPGNGNTVLSCSSTGELEREIAMRLRAGG